MNGLNFSPWHYLGVGFFFVAVIPFITWHISNIPNQTPSLQVFDSDPSCTKSNLLAADTAQSGACTVISALVANKRVMTIYRSRTSPHHQYLITVNTASADNPTFQIVGSNVLSYVSVGQPLYVTLFQRQIVMALINGQAVETVNDPDNTASTNRFRKIVTGISILIGIILWALALKMLFLTPSVPSEPT
ncbi:MAG: hypothetical protein ACRETA_09935 [Gammaproteobacteria bacterium]